MKTNKSFSKRLKITTRGKLISRHAGQNHFNAKEGGRAQMKKGRGVAFVISNKSRSRFISTKGKTRM